MPSLTVWGTVETTLLWRHSTNERIGIESRGHGPAKNTHPRSVNALGSTLTTTSATLCIAQPESNSNHLYKSENIFHASLNVSLKASLKVKEGHLGSLRRILCIHGMGVCINGFLTHLTSRWLLSSKRTNFCESDFPSVSVLEHSPRVQPNV